MYRWINFSWADLIEVHTHTHTPHDFTNQFIVIISKTKMHVYTWYRYWTLNIMEEEVAEPVLGVHQVEGLGQVEVQVALLEGEDLGQMEVQVVLVLEVRWVQVEPVDHQSSLVVTSNNI